MVTRWLLAVSPIVGWDEAGRSAFERWAEAAVSGRTDLVGAELEWLTAEAHRRFTGESTPPPFCAFLSLWCTQPLEPRSLGAPDATVLHALALDDVLRHDFPVDHPAGRTPGVKKTTLWHHAPACEEDWRQRYAGHAEVVLTCHRSACRYRQNLVAAAPTGLGFDACSELWWQTSDALVERFYASETAKAAVKADTVFVERGRSVQAVTVHTVLLEPPHPDGVRRWVPE